MLQRNAGLERVARSPWATEEQYQLFRRYLDARHATGGMADMDMHEFAAMIEETPGPQPGDRILRARASGRPRAELAAVCLTDVLSDGVSMVYSFFDPDRARDSLGSYMILDHIAIAREAGLPYVYLGYWVPGSAEDGLQGALPAARDLRRGPLEPARAPPTRRARPPPRRPPRDQRAGRGDRAARSTK